MAGTTTDPGRRGQEEVPTLRGYLETTPEGEKLYTAAPVGVTGYERMSCWLTVSASAVRDLESMR